MDLSMPKMDGFEVLEKIKADSTTSSIPVIIISNLGQQEDVDKATRLGAAGYLIKANFDSDEIIEKVKEILKY